MQRLEVSGAVRPIYGSLGVKRLIIKDIRLDTCLSEMSPLFILILLYSYLPLLASLQHRKLLSL